MDVTEKTNVELAIAYIEEKLPKRARTRKRLPTEKWNGLRRAIKLIPYLNDEELAEGLAGRSGVWTMKMDPVIKKRWVAALRSGKYKQGQGGLRGGGKYCCLGVLADLVDPSAWVPCGAVGYWTWRDRLTSVKLLDDRTEGLLAHMNDESDKSFSEIADYIEEKL